MTSEWSPAGGAPVVIGMYDSGVGGLSVLRAVWQLLPGVPVIYVADSGRAPYGDRPADEVRRFGEQIARFLRREGATLLVVACNTSSAVALDAVEQAFAGPVVDVLRPGAHDAARRWIGVAGAGERLAAGDRLAAGELPALAVLATRATVNSGAYRRFVTEAVAELLERHGHTQKEASAAGGLPLLEEACPEWVPLVEAGRLGGPEVMAAVERHAHPVREHGAGVAVLGCTHYPFLQPVLRQALPPPVVLVDPAQAAARRAAEYLEMARIEQALQGEPALALEDRRAHDGGPAPTVGAREVADDRYFTSGDPAWFEALFERLVGQAQRASGRPHPHCRTVRWEAPGAHQPVVVPMIVAQASAGRAPHPPTGDAPVPPDELRRRRETAAEAETAAVAAGLGSGVRRDAPGTARLALEAADGGSGFPPARWEGVRVAVIGLGAENLPLVHFLVQQGARVSASDRKPAEALGADKVAMLRQLGVSLVLGDRYLEVLEGAEVAFVTPGMPKHLPALEAARRAGVRITGQMDLFLRLCPAPVVGVTGSSGKTTTTTLVGRMLQTTGRPVFVGGNIGEPLIGRLADITPDAWVVLELSSFQLETMTVSPHGAVVTNITPNHLDVHPSMEAYVEAKSHILRYQRTADFVVLNAGDTGSAALAPVAPGEVLWFGRAARRLPGTWWEADGCWVQWGPSEVPVRWCGREDLRLRGAHNVENVLAAGAAALRCGVAPEAARQVVSTFTGVPHRLEPVARWGDILFVNDSIATSPSRAVAGLRAFDEPVVLIAGGYDKHLPFDELAEVAVARCREVVLLGDTAPAIAAALQQAGARAGHLPPIRRAATFEEAVETAASAAHAGDVVLLSPACASYDMFRNFEERGQRFRELVHQLVARRRGGRDARHE